MGTQFAWHVLGLVLRVFKVRGDAGAKQIESPSRGWDNTIKNK